MTKNNTEKTSPKKKLEKDKTAPTNKDMNELIEAIKNWELIWKKCDFKYNEDLLPVYREQCEQLAISISLFLTRYSFPSVREFDDLLNNKQLNNNEFKKVLSLLIKAISSFCKIVVHKKGVSDPNIIVGLLTQLVEISSCAKNRKYVMSQVQNLIKTWNLKNPEKQIQLCKQLLKTQEMYDLIKDIWNFNDNRNKTVWESRLRNECEELSQRISSFLPRISNPDICEIDDLILPNYGQHNDDSFRLLSKKDMSLFSLFAQVLRIFYIYRIRERRTAITFFGPLTQLLQTSSNTEEYCSSVLSQAEYLIETWNLKNACLALRGMRIVFEKFKRSEYNKSLTSEKTIAWLHKIKNIPEPNCPEKRRIASWMRRQSEIILSFKFKDFEDYRICFERYKWMDKPFYVFNLLDDYEISFIQKLDHLYSFFMSSNDESQRVKFIEYFIMGCKKKDTKHNKSQIKELPKHLQFLYYMRCLVESFYSYSKSVIKGPDQMAKWKEIEKYLRGYKSEPYLSVKSGVFTSVLTFEGQQEGHGISTPSLNPETMSEDLTIEKHIFFDTFLNRLELMNILHAAFWKIADILQMETFPNSYETTIFWKGFNSFSFKNHITYRLIKHESRTLMDRDRSKWHEIILKICPFFYLPRGRENYADDLLKLFKGEDIGKAMLEELYFVVNNVPNW